VYRAVDADGAPFALRFHKLSHDVQMRANVYYEMASEQRILRCLPAHPHILHEQTYHGDVRITSTEVLEAIYDAKPAPYDFAYCVQMEAYDGDLFDLMQAVRPSLASRSSLWRQVLAGLAHMHKHRVVHHDIKLENVLYSRTSDGLRLVLADFGFSAMYVAPEPVCRKLAGSPSYACDEILNGRPYEPFAGDCWSVGCVGFALHLDCLASPNVDAAPAWAQFFQHKKRVPPCEPYMRCVYASFFKGSRAKVERLYVAAGEIAAVIDALLVRQASKRCTVAAALENVSAAIVRMKDGC
jgi:serine/threonine protein kinase